MSAKPSLTLQRRLDAAPQTVFSAWTDPQKLVRWWGPGEIEASLAEVDLRVGGRFRILMRSPDGEDYDVSGEYREVVPDQKLVFTWAWRSTPERQSLVTIVFRREGSGTLLSLTHEQFFDEAARDHHLAGWMNLLDKLPQFLALP
ncbi:SRPBCC family protein [Trinickia mobilis]|uniref:SRPBCC family protein n=1 Tax=Trinickia mobilis TaxID=2816356 RepID=UPI001A8D5005|nr:SRPBCC domain-containing protein [Trinickia mobilis]